MNEPTRIPPEGFKDAAQRGDDVVVDRNPTWSGGWVLQSRIVVRRDAGADKSRGGVLLPETAQDRNKPHEGTVLAFGPGRVLENGTRAKVDEQITVGSRVLFKRYSGSEVSIDGDDIVILEEGDLLCVLATKVEVKDREFRHESPDATPSLRQHLGPITAPQGERKSFPVS